MGTRPWVAYIRVSSEEQAEEGVSLDEQRESCLAWLKAFGHAPTEVVMDDGYSAKDLNRPGISALLNRVRAGSVAGIVVKKLNRLTRNLRDQIDILDLCRESGCDLASVLERIDTETPHGRMFLNLMGSFSQFLREELADNVKAAMTYLKSKGGALGPAPVGCITKEDPDGIKRFHPHPETGPIVSQLWQMAADGSTLVDLAEHLNRHGITTRYGNQWNKSTIRDVLHCNTIIGILTDMRTFTRAHAQVATRSARRPANTRPRINPAAKGVWPLARISWCGHCQAPLVISRQKNRQGHVYHYLRCTGRLKKGKAHCAFMDMNYSVLEQAVIETLRKQLADGRIQESYRAFMAKQAAVRERNSHELPELYMRKAGLQRVRDRILDVVGEGKLVGRAATDRLSELQEQLDLLDAQIQGIEAASDASAVNVEAMAGQLAAMQEGVIHLDKATPEEKCVIFPGLIQRMLVTREHLELELAVPLEGNAGSVLQAPRVALPTVPSGTCPDGPRVGSALSWCFEGRNGYRVEVS